LQFVATTLARYPDPVLLARAEEISEIDAGVRRLAAAMRKCLRTEKGAGLAAPQLGVSRRLIVVEYAPDGAPRKSYDLVNPRIARRSREMTTANEACLSIPGVSADVSRHETVEVQGSDLDWRRVHVSAHGLLARAFQHEIDHLDGILFIDRLPTAERMRIEQEIRQLALA
jgi:peptide deformylase